MSNARDSISDLDSSEKAALARLIRLIARADGDVSAEEHEKISSIAVDAGGPSFWALLDEAAASEDDVDTILGQLEGVGIKAAHELIYGTLYELSIADASGDGENELLDRVAAMWNLEIGDDSDDDSDDES